MGEVIRVPHKMVEGPGRSRDRGLPGNRNERKPINAGRNVVCARGGVGDLEYLKYLKFFLPIL